MLVSIRGISCMSAIRVVSSLFYVLFRPERLDKFINYDIIRKLLSKNR